MAISFTPLGSGSKGNSILVSNERHKFLIDCGFSYKGITEKLALVDVKPEEIEAVIITHEHTDHVKCVHTLSKMCNIPIYATQKTLVEIDRSIGPVNGRVVDMRGLNIGGIDVLPFRIPHDAVDPVGYAFADKNSKALYATDLGHMTLEIKALAKDSDLIMIESNYDETMLKNGPYPVFLKRRIASDTGHLSNSSCSKAILEIIESGPKQFILGHLSENNNTITKAREALDNVMKKAGAEEGKDYMACIAVQHTVTATVLSKCY